MKQSLLTCDHCAAAGRGLQLATERILIKRIADNATPPVALDLCADGLQQLLNDIEKLAHLNGERAALTSRPSQDARHRGRPAGRVTFFDTLAFFERHPRSTSSDVTTAFALSKKKVMDSIATLRRLNLLTQTGRAPREGQAPNGCYKYTVTLKGHRVLREWGVIQAFPPAPTKSVRQIPRVNYLRDLASHPNSTITTLASRLQSTHGAVSMILQRAMKHKLVKITGKTYVSVRTNGSPVSGNTYILTEKSRRSLKELLHAEARK